LSSLIFSIIVLAINDKLTPNYKPSNKLYKLGLDSILRRCVLDHERKDILCECHNGVVGGHVGGNSTAQKIIQDGLWWEMLFKDEKVYVISV
jgi:hypothetical protein